MSSRTDVGVVAEQARDAASAVRRGAREAARSRWLRRGARIGMAARSVVYLVIAWLALELALGHHSREADQNGALRSIASRTGGREVVIVLAVGFAIYAVWRLSVAFFGDAGRTGWRTRLDGVIGFVGYGALCLTAVSLAIGVGNQSGGSARQATSLTARVMKHSGGRAAVVVVGIVVTVAGLLIAVEGFRRSFLDDLRTHEMPAPARRLVVPVGFFGNVARGVVIVLVGALLVDAGWTFRPQKSRGVDGALQELARTTAGPWLLGAVALGLLAFALYSLAEARYRRT